MHLIVNNKKIRAKFITFAGGEEHVQLCMEDVEKVLGEAETMVAYGYLKSSRDVMRFFNMVSAGNEAFDYPFHLTLNIPYLPYARQDRVCSPGQAFGVDMFTSLLSALRADEVMVDDVHSKIAKGLGKNKHISVTEMPQSRLFMNYYNSPNNRDKFRDFVFVAPDKGAVKKTSELGSRLYTPVALADKIRDPSAGQITHTAVDWDDFGGRGVWIVDDICDGGRTFTELAKVLKEKNCGKLGLFVTHGIFSKGKDVLYEHFDYVAAAHDWTIPEIREEF